MMDQPANALRAGFVRVISAVTGYFSDVLFVGRGIMNNSGYKVYILTLLLFLFTPALLATAETDFNLGVDAFKGCLLYTSPSPRD